MTRALTLLTAIGCVLVTMLQAWEPMPYRDRSGATTTLMPKLYFSSEPNKCLYMEEGNEYQVYAYAPDLPGLDGVSFDLYLSSYGAIPEPIIYTGVGTSITYDTSSIPYHVEVAWDPQTLDHTPVVNLFFPVDPQLAGNQYPSNVVFTQGGGEISGYGVGSFLGCCVDCFPCGLWLYADDHVFVLPGQTTAIPFQYSWGCYAIGGGPIDATDTEGWVTSWEPTVGGGPPCDVCIAPETYGVIYVTVPPGTQAGTTTTVTLSTFTGDTEEIVVEVEGPVTTEVTTWGKVKALYR